MFRAKDCRPGDSEAVVANGVGSVTPGMVPFYSTKAGLLWAVALVYPARILLPLRLKFVNPRPEIVSACSYLIPDMIPHIQPRKP